MNDNIKLTISEFIDYCRNEKMFSKHTISAYKHDLDLMYFNFNERGIKNLKEVDYDLLNIFLAEQLENKKSIRTIARRLSSIKSFFKYLLSSEVIKNNPASFIKTPKIKSKIPTYVQKNKINELMKLPNLSKVIGVRDRAILETFYATGIRLSELTGINIGSFNIEENLVKVLGKGGKERFTSIGRERRKG